MLGHRLTLGISEDRDFKYPKIDATAFRSNGRYRSALHRLDSLTSSPGFEVWARTYWDRCVASGGTLPAADYETARERFKGDIAWILAYESEHARIWSEGPVDYKSTLRRYQKSARFDAKRVREAIRELSRFDTKHAYLLRLSLQAAMQKFLSEEKIKTVRQPNVNLDKGFKRVTVSGPVVREVEFRFLSQLSFFHLDKLLAGWDREIESMFSEWPAHWSEFGALRFEKPLSPKVAGKLNVVQLGLIAHLTSRLRDFTAGYGIWSYGTGQPIPTHGKPCWDIVAEFVNSALSPPRELTGEGARRVWQSMSAKHSITMQAWPRPSKSESQVQEI